MSNKLTIAGDVACDLVMTDDKGNYVRPYDKIRHIRRVALEAAKHGVVAKMIDPEGPGGGHPVYEFTGTRAQLEAFVTEFYEGGEADAETIEFYFEDATPVEDK